MDIPALVIVITAWAALFVGFAWWVGRSPE